MFIRLCLSGWGSLVVCLAYRLQVLCRIVRRYFQARRELLESATPSIARLLRDWLVKRVKAIWLQSVEIWEANAKSALQLWMGVVEAAQNRQLEKVLQEHPLFRTCRDTRLVCAQVTTTTTTPRSKQDCIRHVLSCGVMIRLWLRTSE